MAVYLRQGELRFVPGYKLQTRWGVTEAGVFTLECSGALLVAMALLWGAPRSAFMAGLAMVISAIVLLLAHLGHPSRAWRAVVNVRTSWISRGTLALGGFVVCGAAYLVVAWGDGGATATALQAGLQWAMLALALFIGIYPGLVLSASPAISFWSSGLLPVLSLLQGAASAALLLLAFRAYGEGAPQAPLLLWTALWLLAAHAAALAIYLGSMLRRGAAAAESVRHLLRAHRWEFVALACLLGIALPVLVAGFALASGAAVAPAILAMAALARLTGDFALRHAFLKVGMFEPVI